MSGNFSSSGMRSRPRRMCASTVCPSTLPARFSEICWILTVADLEHNDIEERWFPVGFSAGMRLATIRRVYE